MLASGAREGERPGVALREPDGVRECRTDMLGVREGETGDRVGDGVRDGDRVGDGVRDGVAVTLGERELDGTVADTLAEREGEGEGDVVTLAVREPLGTVAVMLAVRDGDAVMLAVRDSDADELAVCDAAGRSAAASTASASRRRSAQKQTRAPPRAGCAGARRVGERRAMKSGVAATACGLRRETESASLKIY